MVPYQCKKCDVYHLATKERQTEIDECEYCTGADGSPKQLYLTMQGAQKRADILLEEQGMRLYLYECPYQDGWHLTKKIK